jgi:DNA invertase Pin-like site-specific DNA recombinase
MTAVARRSVRCAIYTRVSTESGLEQDFNSLDAQYDAAQAYIRSQAHAGWTLVRTRYDDGGFSGGSTDRPALQQLLDDIRAHRINVIVVYKVDRLTRSLADFAKLVELFDAHGVSFVSVTQQFNPTTSMGRLTLNVLLSFAQFEREVTSERIRDKIGASKRKGLWVGALNGPRDSGSFSGTIKSFDKSSYTKPEPPGALSLAHNGYVYVPKDCEALTGPACRVHIVLHGCKQNAESVGRQLVDKTSFNAWADTNQIIVLYPQTTARSLWLGPYNPLGCWDWWGYLSGDNSYVTKSGRQIKAIKLMLDALTADYRAGSGAPAPDTPGALVINDTSDTAVALAWAPIKSASGCRRALHGWKHSSKSFRRSRRVSTTIRSTAFRR